MARRSDRRAEGAGRVPRRRRADARRGRCGGTGHWVRVVLEAVAEMGTGTAMRLTSVVATAAAVALRRAKALVTVPRRAELGEACPCSPVELGARPPTA